MKRFHILAVFLFNVVFVHGYLPRLVVNNDLSLGHPNLISNLEISQAFYGELRDRPNYYKIISDSDFALYINIMAPDIPDARTDFSVEIYGVNKAITLNGALFDWEKYFEKFAGNNYLKGPSYEDVLSKGEYLIQVSNPDNLGKYVLVIGEQESFPLKEAINSIFVMPKLKNYFGKSLISSYFNQFGLFLFIFLMVFIVLIILLILLIQYWSKPKYQKL